MGSVERQAAQQNTRATGFPSWKDRVEAHRGDKEQQNERSVEQREEQPKKRMSFITKLSLLIWGIVGVLAIVHHLTAPAPRNEELERYKHEQEMKRMMEEVEYWRKVKEETTEEGIRKRLKPNIEALKAQEFLRRIGPRNTGRVAGEHEEESNGRD
jgi:hypothetical protein